MLASDHGKMASDAAERETGASRRRRSTGASEELEKMRDAIGRARNASIQHRIGFEDCACVGGQLPGRHRR